MHVVDIQSNDGYNYLSFSGAKSQNTLNIIVIIIFPFQTVKINQFSLISTHFETNSGNQLLQIIGKAGGKKGRGAFREVHYVDTRSPSLPRPSERGEALEKAQSPVLAEILTALVIKALVLREPPLPFRRDRLKPPDPRNPVLHAPRNQVEPREERRKIREEKFSNDLGV